VHHRVEAGACAAAEIDRQRRIRRRIGAQKPEESALDHFGQRADGLIVTRQIRGLGIVDVPTGEHGAAHESVRQRALRHRREFTQHQLGQTRAQSRPHVPRFAHGGSAQRDHVRDIELARAQQMPQSYDILRAELPRRACARHRGERVHVKARCTGRMLAAEFGESHAIHAVTEGAAGSAAHEDRRLGERAEHLEAAREVIGPLADHEVELRRERTCVQRGHEHGVRLLGGCRDAVERTRAKGNPESRFEQQGAQRHTIAQHGGTVATERGVSVTVVGIELDHDCTQRATRAAMDGRDATARRRRDRDSVVRAVLPQRLTTHHDITFLHPQTRLRAEVIGGQHGDTRDLARLVDARCGRTGDRKIEAARDRMTCHRTAWRRRGDGHGGKLVVQSAPKPERADNWGTSQPKARHARAHHWCRRLLEHARETAAAPRGCGGRSGPASPNCGDVTSRP
jgi:hypothetical protein